MTNQMGRRPKIVQNFKLDMYENALTQPLFAALQRHITAALQAENIPEEYKNALFLGQICGIELAHAQTNHTPCPYHYLASFELANTQINRGYYYSVLVASKHRNALEQLTDIQNISSPPLKLAINQKGSFSGDVLAQAFLLNKTNLTLPISYSGSHVKSLQMLATGRADIAAIDCISFHMALQAHPELSEGLHILGQTDSFPGLPFICAASLPDSIKHTIKTALFAFKDTSEWAGLSAALGVVDIVSLSADIYPPMYQFEHDVRAN